MKRKLSAILFAVFLLAVFAVPSFPGGLLAGPRVKYWDSNGHVLTGGKLYTYKAGTSTPQAAYTDYACTIPAANPIILDANGEATVFLNGLYKLNLTDSAGVQISGFPVDNVSGTAGAGTASSPSGSATPGIGSAVNLNGLTASNTTFTWSVAEIVVEDSTGNTSKVRNLSGTVNSASTGALGLDLGALPASCWMHFFAAQKSDASAQTIFMSPVASGQGTGLTVNVTGVSGGHITTLNGTPTAGGTGYKVGDIFRITTGDGTALGQVTAVSTTMPIPGVVTGVATSPVYAGVSGYLTGGPQATTVYPTLPTGYSQIGYLGACYVDGSSHFISTKQTGGSASVSGTQVASGAGVSTVSMASVVPPTAKTVNGYYFYASGSIATLSSDSSGLGGLVNSTSAGNELPFSGLAVLTPQDIYITAGAGVSVYISGWTY